MTPSYSPDTVRLLSDDSRSQLRERWQRVQERFVDDPRGSVEQADELVQDVVEQIRESLDHRRSVTRQGWLDIDDATTEQLREALHNYEVLFGQLADAPAPNAWHDDSS